MTEPMPDARFNQIRDREAAATPGPWETPGPDTIGQWMISDGEWTVAEASAYSHNDPYSSKPDARGPGYIDSDANAAFIAHARQDVPDLLAEIELLRGDNTALVCAAQIYLDALDADPENEYVTFLEAFRLTMVREAVERWDRRNA
jgi:hypothetical protein